MNLETNRLYHIYNQGNNKQKIFFSRENYHFFLKKIRLYILPHADILAWCLMPNHFHLMVYVKTIESPENNQPNPVKPLAKIPNLNDSIGLLLRTYTRAINKQENRTGSLFKPHTHAEYISDQKGMTSTSYNNILRVEIAQNISEEEYPQICFNYIHFNPVKAKLVRLPEDWEFSSIRDYLALRNWNIINTERALSFGLHL